MDFCVAGAPVTRKRRQLRGYLVEICRTNPTRFATFPDDRVDIDDAKRAVLHTLLAEMVDNGLYQRERCADKVSERLLTLRELIREARALA